MSNVLLINGGGWHSWLIPQLSLPYLSSALNEAGHNVQVIDLNLEFRNRILLNPERITAAVAQADLSYMKGFTRRECDFLKQLRRFPSGTVTAVTQFAIQVGKELHTGEIRRSTGDMLSLLQEIVSRSISPCSWDIYYLDPQVKEKLDEGILPSSAQGLLCDSYRNVITNVAEEIIAEYDKFSPELVGFSIDDEQQLPLILFLAALARELSCPPRLIVAGGYFFEKVLNLDLAEQNALSSLRKLRPFFDCIVHGCGVRTLLDILALSKMKWSLSSVGGCLDLSRPQRLMIGRSGRPELRDTNWNALKTHQYVGMPLRISEGCPFGLCAFCRHTRMRHRMSGRPLRDYYQSMPPKQISEMLKRKLSETGLKRVEFVDLGLHPYQLSAIAEAMEETGAFWGAQSRFDLGFDASRLAKFAESGARYLALGVETFAPRLMNMFHKGYELRHVRSVLDSLYSEYHRIHGLLIVNLMWGFPTESWNEFRETIDVARSLGLQGSLLKFELLPGSPVHINPSSFGITQINIVRRFLADGPPLSLTWGQQCEEDRKREYLLNLAKEGWVCGYNYNFDKPNQLNRRFPYLYWMGQTNGEDS